MIIGILSHCYCGLLRCRCTVLGSYCEGVFIITVCPWIINSLFNLKLCFICRKLVGVLVVVTCVCIFDLTGYLSRSGICSFRRAAARCMCGDLAYSVTFIGQIIIICLNFLNGICSSRRKVGETEYLITRDGNSCSYSGSACGSGTLNSAEFASGRIIVWSYGCCFTVIFR